MTVAHGRVVLLGLEFDTVFESLRDSGEVNLITRIGTPFSARAELTKKGPHQGEKVIRFYRHGLEFGRAYACCWGHYYNCNRTPIGMYCEALCSAMM